MIKLEYSIKLEAYMSLYKIRSFFSVDMDKFINLYKFEKGEFICMQGETLEYLFFMVEGRARVCKHMENGKTFLVSFYNPLSIVGDMEFVGNEIADCTVEIMEDTYCIGMRFEDVRNILVNDSRFLFNICRYMGKKLASNSTNNSINTLHPLENRLASYIAAFLKDDDGNGSFFEFKQSYSEVAELLGTSYRHLNRTLNKFCDEGIIRKACGQYIIENIDRLKLLARDLYKWNL